ncbi:MAG: helix-turn-helix domain-containing protein [Stomatobaculum sp.]|nr:helix-turn-helix domain-containing protein [Stomatobaculum sp.]
MLTNIEIGSRISSTRDLRGLTLDDVASRVGVAKSTISRYEKGTITKIKLPVIESIAKALEVDPNWLIGNTDLPVPASSFTPVVVLKPDEHELVSCYRSMNTEGQTAALAAVRGLAAVDIYKKRDSAPDILDHG